MVYCEIMTPEPKIDATVTYQLVFHGEDLLDRYPFEKVPDGKYVVRGELKDESGFVVGEFDWSVTLKNDCLYPSNISLNYVKPWRFVRTR